MKNLMAIISRNQYGCCSTKIVFDSREKMPIMDDITVVLKKFMPEIQNFKVIEPAVNNSGKYLDNWFDVLSYDGEHSYEEFDTKTIYENRELIEDFKQNPDNIWKAESISQKTLINVTEFAEIYDFNRSMQI